MWTQKMSLKALCAVLMVVGFAAACEKPKEEGVKKPAGGEFVPEGAKKKGGDGEFVPGKEEQKSGKAAKAEFKGAGQYLLKSGEEKLKLDQGPDYYTKENLFEIIDGASDGYIAYGMIQMAKGVYMAEQEKFKDEVNIEIYQYGPKNGAFGKFGEERSSCGGVEEHGDNWCIRQSDLIFWKGSMMVKVQTFDDSPEAEAAILKIAKLVEGKMPGAATPPAFMSKFPAADRIKGSGSWSPRALFGFSELKDAYTAEYRPAGEQYKAEGDFVTLFGAERASAEDAKKLFESLKSTAEKNEKIKAAGGLKALGGAGEQAFVYKDNYGTYSLVLKGKIVAGGRDFKDDATAERLTKALAQSL